MKAVLITSSILILLLAALRPILRGRIDPRLQYALWLVVALRLLVPVNLVSSAYSALALLNRAEEPPQIIEAIGQTAIPVMSYQDAYDQALQEYKQNGRIPATVNTYEDLAAYERVEYRAHDLMRGPTLAELAQRLARPVWLGGAALMGLWFLLVNLRLRRQLKGAAPVDADCPLPVYVSGALPSPCLCGAVRTAVYVTPAAVETPERLRHVLAHELTHYRHRDHWWALARCLCLCLYWFDPLVWWAAALSRQDCELACDEGAIRALGEAERLSYGRTLVSMIAAGRNSLLQTATTMTGGKKRVKERVALIARRPKTVAAAALVLAIVLGLAVGCTFTGAPSEGSAATLQERLMDVPEELRPTVQARSSDSPNCLVEYWFEVPAEWVDERLPWLLSVNRWDRAQIDAGGYPDTNDEISVLFAQDSRWYYAIMYPPVGATSRGIEGYIAAYEAIRAFAEQTVLAAEGVEPYPDLQPLDTLQERLLDIPEELKSDVVDRSSESRQPYVVLADYWLSTPVDWDSYLDTSDPWELGMGWLLRVEQLDQAQFEDILYTYSPGRYVFARDSEHYYAIARPTDVRAIEETAERYNAASQLLPEFVRQQVLSTQGVEPLDLDELRSREYLQDGKTYADVVYWPYKAVNGSVDIEWVYRMVQPADQGRGGVWIPERMTCYDPVHGVDPTPQLIKPDTGGLSIAEYAARLQAEADAGNADWATDPVEALRRYEQESSSRTIPLDSFAFIDGSGTGDYRPESWRTPEQQAIYSTISDITAASGTSFTLTANVLTANVLNPYIYEAETPPSDYWSLRLNALIEDFEWEELTESQAEAVMAQSAGVSLLIAPTGLATSSSIYVYQDSPLMAVSAWNGAITYYTGTYVYSHGQGTTPYDCLRPWFDEVELASLRAPWLAVDDYGQSHEEIAHKWALEYEGAYLKCAPGGSLQCSFMQVTNVKADLPDWLENEEQLSEFAQAHGLTAEGFGTDWFGFSYTTVFVPVDQSTTNGFWAGNTWYYEGDADWAPEGALTYSRIGTMRLIDGYWVCEGTGTGW